MNGYFWAHKNNKICVPVFFFFFNTQCRQENKLPFVRRSEISSSGKIAVSFQYPSIHIPPSHKGQQKQLENSEILVVLHNKNNL